MSGASIVLCARTFRLTPASKWVLLRIFNEYCSVPVDLGKQQIGKGNEFGWHRRNTCDLVQCEKIVTNGVDYDVRCNKTAAVSYSVVATTIK